MRRTFQTVATRILLIALGLLLVAAGLLYSLVPKPSGDRLEASPTVTGIEAGGAYAWVIRTAHGAALVDCGLDPKAEAILAELRRQGLTAADVHTVVLTHAHRDHWAGCAVFGRAKIWIGAADLPYLKGEKNFTAPLVRLFVRLGTAPPQPNCSPLETNAEVKADGLTLRSVATPGHTPGSTMYLWEDLLFTGDSLVAKGKGVGILPGLTSEDAAANRASLAPLLALPFTRIADGHTGLTVDARQKLGRWLK